MGTGTPTRELRSLTVGNKIKSFYQLTQKVFHLLFGQRFHGCFGINPGSLIQPKLEQKIMTVIFYVGQYNTVMSSVAEP
jgi:hypothetical protein